MSARPVGPRVLVVAPSDARARVLEETILALLPSSTITAAAREMTAIQSLSEYDVGVIEVPGDASGDAELVRRLRQGGLAGRLVVIAERPAPALESAVRTHAGRGCLTSAEISEQPQQLADAMMAGAADDAAGTAELVRLRRALAAGENALRLQHAINNPLAGLLAETQLLQLEPLTAEQQAAVSRILELCRRVVTLVRQLDAAERVE